MCHNVNILISTELCMKIVDSHARECMVILSLSGQGYERKQFQLSVYGFFTKYREFCLEVYISVVRSVSVFPSILPSLGSQVCTVSLILTFIFSLSVRLDYSRERRVSVVAEELVVRL